MDKVKSLVSDISPSIILSVVFYDQSESSESLIKLLTLPTATSNGGLIHSFTHNNYYNYPYVKCFSKISCATTIISVSFPELSMKLSHYNNVVIIIRVRFICLRRSGDQVYMHRLV